MFSVGVGGAALSAGGPPDLQASPATGSQPTLDLQAREIAPPPVQQERRLTGNPLWAIPLSSLSITRERPIFRQSRRPPAPAVAAAPAAEPPRQPAPPEVPQTPQLTLVGAIVGPSDGIAIFLDQANGNAVVRLRTGEEHGGWVLHSLKGREAILRKDSENVVLALPAPDSTAPPVGSDVQPGPPQMPVSPVANSADPMPPAPPASSSGALIVPKNPSDFAPYIPRSTPRNGESDGL